MEIIKTVLPFLVTVLSGPVPGMAIQLLSKIFPNKEIDTPEKLQEEYQKITQYENSDVDKNSPDYLMQKKINENILVEIENAENKLKLKFNEAGISSVLELEKIYAGDLQNARNRQIVMNDDTPRLIALIITVVIIALVLLLMFVNIPSNNKDLITQVVLTIVAGWGGMMAYYFSTTARSKEKDERIERLQKNMLKK
jgi:uncharacterized membrane-anchored protein